MRTRITLKAIIIVFLFSITPVHALDLAPQEEGPSLEETLKWIKNKIDSLHGFTHWNTGGSIGHVEYTSFDIDNDYIVTIKQKVDRGDSAFGRNIDMVHFVCDMKELSGANTFGGTTLDINFSKKCKIFDGKTTYTGEYGYPANPPSIRSGDTIDTGDPEIASKLAKAFNHAAKLFEKMPKKRSNELF